MLDQLRLVMPGINRSASALKVVSDYISLTKPPIVILLLITAISGIFLAARGGPSVSLILLVCAGGALGAGGANALNHFLDKDIDELMSRTKQRPVASDRISPVKALAFGILLNIFSFVILAAWVNLFAAVLTLAATLFYVFVYTNWLKRTTTQNIVIGGAAGSIPPVVGWVAVTGSLDLPALYLFAVVFFWTPPHFWALAMLIQKDYEAAKIPMLPVVAGREHTVQVIFMYSLVLVAISLVFATTSAVGLVYLGSAAVLGAIFVALAWNLKGDITTKRARTLYLFSLLYLALLFVAMIADSKLYY